MLHDVKENLQWATTLFYNAKIIRIIINTEVCKVALQYSMLLKYIPKLALVYSATKLLQWKHCDALRLQLQHNNAANSVAGSSLLKQLVELKERMGGDRKEQGRSRGWWEGGLKDGVWGGERERDGQTKSSATTHTAWWPPPHIEVPRTWPVSVCRISFLVCVLQFVLSYGSHSLYTCNNWIVRSRKINRRSKRRDLMPVLECHVSVPLSAPLTENNRSNSSLGIKSAANTTQKFHRAHWLAKIVVRLIWN